MAAGCTVAISLIVVLANYLLIGRYGKYVVADQDQLARLVEGELLVGIVLGGGIEDNKPMPLLRDRLDAAAALLDSGRIRKVIVSGDNRVSRYDEPSVMKNYLIQERSIDPGRIQPDYAGRSTYETCERARKVFDLKQVLLISEGTHLPRAIYLCRSFGLEAYGYGSDGQSSAGLQVGQRWREVLARTKATINIYLIGEQTVPGDKLPL